MDNDAVSDGVIELSNFDLGDELVDLFLGANQFRASAHVFGSSTKLVDELVQLGRR